ncbi:MAG: ABC transporter permease [Alphaproteobacteria bacterium]|nr:ABC transporter permease [Alphaproteobacteria bacterium]
MSPGLADIIESAKLPRLILYMAWSDIRARYKRSVLGPLWITISTAIGVVGMGFIWSELFKMKRDEFIPMLTVGLIMWQFMSACITEATVVFSRQAGIIRNLNLPISIHPAQLVLRHVINLAHNIPLFFLVVLILGRKLDLHLLMFVPGLLLVIANLYWMSMMLGILGARFRDLEYLVTMVMPLLMFVSPVMYSADSLPKIGKYMWLNPLGDMIEIVRYPLLAEATPHYVYVVNIGLLLIGALLTLILFNAKRDRIAFWV